MTDKKLLAALKAANESLEYLYKYASQVRHKVITQDTGSITFIDLDSLDDYMLQVKANKQLIESKKKGAPA